MCIYFCSIAGHAMPDFPGCAVYVASKHAVTVLTEYLRKELASAESKIRVTVRKSEKIIALFKMNNFWRRASAQDWSRRIFSGLVTTLRKFRRSCSQAKCPFCRAQILRTQYSMRSRRHKMFRYMLISFYSVEVFINFLDEA